MTYLLLHEQKMLFPGIHPFESMSSIKYLLCQHHPLFSSMLWLRTLFPINAMSSAIIVMFVKFWCWLKDSTILSNCLRILMKTQTHSKRQVNVHMSHECIVTYSLLSSCTTLAGQSSTLSMIVTTSLTICGIENNICILRLCWTMPGRY